MAPKAGMRRLGAKMENTLPQGLLDEVMSLSEEEKRALARALKEMIASELAISAGLVVPTKCPHCGGEHIVKKGRDSGGNQRFLCKSCMRTFGASTLSIMGQTKLTESQWMAYAEGMADGRTLRELQERCGVTLKTSWFMRMRVLEAMGRHLDQFRSGPGVAVEADGKMVHESFKGNNRRGTFEMPRRRHKSGEVPAREVVLDQPGEQGVRHGHDPALVELGVLGRYRQHAAAEVHVPHARVQGLGYPESAGVHRAQECGYHDVPVRPFSGVSG